MWIVKLSNCVSLQETSMCTPTREPPTLSSISLVVDVLMRGARRWWRKTRVRSVTHKAQIHSVFPPQEDFNADLMSFQCIL